MSTAQMPIPYQASTDEVPKTQHGQIFELMRDGGWYSLTEIQSLIWHTFGRRCTETNISMRLREFNYGRSEWRMEKSHEGKGLWLYRLVRMDA